MSEEGGFGRNIKKKKKEKENPYRGSGEEGEVLYTVAMRGQGAETLFPGVLGYLSLKAVKGLSRPV